MVEAKDYSIEGKKVGRGDIQKQAGALNDLPIKQGIFASAIDYTALKADESLYNQSYFFYGKIAKRKVSGMWVKRSDKMGATSQSSEI